MTGSCCCVCSCAHYALVREFLSNNAFLGYTNIQNKPVTLGFLSVNATLMKIRIHSSSAASQMKRKIVLCHRSTCKNDKNVLIDQQIISGIRVFYQPKAFCVVLLPLISLASTPPQPLTPSLLFPSVGMM